VVTDDRTLASDRWLVSAEAVLETGGASIALHVRGPGTPGRRVFDLARHLVPRARRVGAWLIVNDRVDVALATGADGVHLGRRPLPVAAARDLLPTGARVGVSVHGADEAERAGAEGADYAFVGTIFPTPSHQGLPGMGVNGLRDAAERARGLPVIAIGGIDVGRAVEAMRAGASGSAVLRGVWSAPDPARAVGEFVRAIEGAIDG
jgi:thiamine-phosphate pyrophosphorylase